MDHRPFRPAVEEGSSRFALWGAWLIVFLGVFASGADWEAQHGLFLTAGGVLLLLAPPKVSLPRVWWVLALLFLLLSAAPFLPAAWFPVPGWRRELEALGVETGDRVAIQWRQSLEMYGVFAALLVVGLGVAGHRPSSWQLRNIALAFALGAAATAILAILLQDTLPVSRKHDGHLGFFPNRNHNGTYLAMGTVCGLGVALQAIRDRQAWRIAAGLLASLVCISASAFWSISRGGIVMIAVGSLLWIVLVGPRYLGRHGTKAVALFALLVVGGYLLSETRVKSRMEVTQERVEATLDARDNPEAERPPEELAREIDFRVPIAQDTFDMIAAAPWTGFGQAQFQRVFPQYRDRAAAQRSGNVALHPESDWLWMATEAGVPATAALLLLVVAAGLFAFRKIRAGRDRALRTACLVGALLVPIHGFFDVPGHRLPLALAPAVLLALALPSPGSRRTAGWHRWMVRLAGLALLAAGVPLLAWRTWPGGERPQMTLEENAYSAAAADYRAAVSPPEDAKLMFVFDKLDAAASRLDKSADRLPMEPRLHHLAGHVDSHFEERHAEASRHFAIERVLVPHWPELPLLQSQAWLAQDTEKVRELWREALRRAEAVAAQHPTEQGRVTAIERRIRQLAGKNPELREIADEMAGR